MQGSPNDPRWVDDEGTFHEWYDVELFVGETSLGAFKIDPGAHPEGRWRRSGIAFFCRNCGNIWGRISFKDSQGRITPYDVEQVSCKIHKVYGWIHDASGSFVSNTTTNWLTRYLPLLALRREFQVCHEHYTKRYLPNDPIFSPPRPDQLPT